MDLGEPATSWHIVGTSDLVELLLKGQGSVIWTQLSDPEAGHHVGVKHTWSSSELG